MLLYVGYAVITMSLEVAIAEVDLECRVWWHTPVKTAWFQKQCHPRSTTHLLSCPPQTARVLTGICAAFQQ